MTHVPPVACPDCGERQNEITHPSPAATGGEQMPEVRCLACGHVFTEAQYRSALARAGQAGASEGPRS